MASQSASDLATTGVGSTSALEFVKSYKPLETMKFGKTSTCAAESESGSGANVDGKRWANFHVQSGLSS
ncbi:hypothetical protein Tco_0021130 [Tanacetum coccineum]